MEIKINGESLVVEENAFLADVMEHLKLHEKRGIAAAVNETVIPRDRWTTHQLSPKDSILLITATQGG